MSRITRAVNSGDYRYDDQQVIVGATKFAGVSDPSWTPYKGCYVLTFAKDADNIVYFTVQFSHQKVTGSDVEFHAHLAYPDNGAGNSRWHFTHSWSDIGGTFPGATTVSKTIASPTTQDMHQYAEIAASIDGSGITGVSSIMLCSLQREGSDGVNDTYDDVIYVVGIDFHITIDELGSQAETSK